MDFLARDNLLGNWNDRLDRIVPLEDEIDSDDQTYNFVAAYDDYVLSSELRQIP